MTIPLLFLILFSANNPPIIILTQFTYKSSSFMHHFTLGLLPSKFNYNVTVSPQVQNKTFLQIDQQQSYNLISDTMYNFTLTNTDCTNKEYLPPSFTYGKCIKKLFVSFTMIFYLPDMECPIIDIMFQMNPVTYLIRTDGSMNITGMCGNYEVTLYECDISGEWIETSACDNGKSE